MRKTTLAFVLMGASFVCAGESITKAPILFKGMDEIPITSICTSETIASGNDSFGVCALSLDEYAGEKVIQRSKDDGKSYLDYSHAQFDLESKKVISLYFVMRYGAFDRVSEILELKYGKANKDGDSTNTYSWYGDKDRNALIRLVRYEPKASFMGQPDSDGSTVLIIITAAMRKVEDAVKTRELRSRQENKIKALKGL